MAVRRLSHCTSEHVACTLYTQMHRLKPPLPLPPADLVAGYTTVSIDDCWEAPRVPKGSPNASLKGDPKRFPLGMKALGDYMHSKGVRFGMWVRSARQRFRI
jgi:hypothetical protein